MLGVKFQQSLYATVKDQAESKLSVNHRKTMSWLSRAIELTALKASSPVRVFSGFQSMQFFLPVLNRYTRLAQKAEVYIYGYPDVIPPTVPGIHYVQLAENDPLVKEWFIVVDSPDFCNALVTEDEAGLSVPHERRRFKGLLTYDRATVQRLDDALSRQIDLPAEDKGPIDIRRTLVIDMVNTLQAASRRVQNDTTLSRELSLIINQYIMPVVGL